MAGRRDNRYTVGEPTVKADDLWVRLWRARDGYHVGLERRIPGFESSPVNHIFT